MCTVYHLQVRLSIGEEYALYKGENESDVFHKYTQSSRNWFQLMPWWTETVTVALFNKTCLGISTKKPYSVDFKIKCTCSTTILIYFYF